MPTFRTPLLILLVTLASCAQNKSPAPRKPPSVTVEQITYNGWPNSWRVRNSACQLVVVPAVSRVIRFSLAGGPNGLWEKPELACQPFPADDGTWHNIGGCKIL